MTIPGRRLAVLLLAGGVAVSACGSEGAAPAATLPPVNTATIPGDSTGTTLPAVVEIVGVYDDVDFYPACGDTPLSHEGVWWYPIVDPESDWIDDELRTRIEGIFAFEREPSPVGPQGVVRVAPPGPGDDVGTLVIWADGTARWVSDSGDLDVWMIDEEFTYNLLC